MLILTTLLLFSHPLATPPAESVPHALAVRFQDPEEELEELFEEYRDKLREKGEENRCIQLIDLLTQRYKKLDERITEIEEMLEFGEGDTRDLKKEGRDLRDLQEDIAEVVANAFAARRRPTPANYRIWRSAVYAFGQMGADGPEYLWKVFEDDRFDRDVEFHALVVEQVGFTKDYEQWEELTDLLDYKDEGVIAAAASALAQFKDAPGKIRRESTEVLVKRLESYHNRASNVEDTNSARIYGVVRGPMIRALTALTGQNYRDPLDWTKWWNNNKNDRDLWRDRD